MFICYAKFGFYTTTGGTYDNGIQYCTNILCDITTACLTIPQTFIRGITCTCYYVGSIMMDTVDTGRQLTSTTTSIQWLRSTLLPRIIKWAETGCDQLSHASSGTSNNSMRCIDVEVYYSKYTVMKDKYGKAICEVGALSKHFVDIIRSICCR